MNTEKLFQWNNDAYRYECEAEEDGHAVLYVVDGDKYSEAREKYEREANATYEQADAFLSNPVNWSGGYDILVRYDGKWTYADEI